MLELTDISKSFDGRKVLDGVSFSLGEGGVFVLLGANGSGKSTLFNVLSGFIKEDTGAVFYNGKKINGKSPFEISRIGIGRTFQDLRLINQFSVEENLMLSFPFQEGESLWRVFFSGDKIRKEQSTNLMEAQRIMERCFLSELSGRKAGELSFGEQKLLSIACCIASGASLLLLDEPVAGINPLFRERMVKIVTDLKDEGRTLLIIEHNSDFIEAVASEILFLHEGIVSHYDSYTEYRASEYVQNAFVK